MLFRRVRAEFSDGVIDLLPLRLYPPEKEMGFGRVYDYMIVPHGTHREVGRISLRMGESPCVYYFGHIGYHVDCYVMIGRMVIWYIRKKKCQHRPHFLYCRFYNAAAFRNFHHSHPERHDSCHRNS